MLTVRFRWQGRNTSNVSGPLCVNVVTQYHVNQFKIDGIGAGVATGSNSTDGAGNAIRDFEAMLRLNGDLRTLEPDLYINQTTGTWPSPFWLINADSIWRGGEDLSFAGCGSDRQRCITYRDSDVYARVVSMSELYPISSIMPHGMIYAKSADRLNVAPKEDFKSARSLAPGRKCSRCTSRHSPFPR